MGGRVRHVAVVRDEIDDIFANLAGGRTQQAQRLRVAIEEVGMAAQIGDDVATADLARQLARRCGIALAERLVARQVDHGSYLAPARRGARGPSRAGHQVIIR